MKSTAFLMMCLHISSLRTIREIFNLGHQLKGRSREKGRQGSHIDDVNRMYKSHFKAVDEKHRSLQNVQKGVSNHYIARGS